MNAQTANSQFSFQLPSMSYIDAKWEEPELRAGASTVRSARRRGIASWIAARVAAFRAWRLEQQTVGELTGMTDRELMDIGVTRADLGRLFIPAHNADLRARGSQG
jgi:uncharacterized protein YjiS (DUF1127 family)